MAQTTVGARIPAPLVRDLAYVAKEEKADKSKVLRDLLASAIQEKLVRLAFQKYAQRQVSLGRAAELARLPLVDFMRRAADAGIPLNYPREEVERDVAAALAR